MSTLRWASGLLRLSLLLLVLPLIGCGENSSEARISAIERRVDLSESSANPFDQSQTVPAQSDNSFGRRDSIARSKSNTERLERLRSSQEHRNRVLNAPTPLEKWIESTRPYDGTLSNKISEPAKSALQKAKEFELLSLDPARPEKRYPDQYLRRWILGSTVINDADAREKLLAALDIGVRQFDEDDDVSDCFDPRHAIRVQHEGKSIYLLICFECEQVYVYIDDELDRNKWFPIKASAQPVFDEVLKAAGVPLPKPAVK